MRLSRILGLALLAMASQASSGNRHVNGKLLCIGVFDEEYLKGASEGPWQALCPATDGFALRPTSLRMTAAPPLAGDNGPRPRREVEALECPNALVLIGLGALTDGHVSTAFSGNIQLQPAAETVLEVGSSSYRLAARETHPHTLELVLRFHEIEQRISVVEGCCNDAYPTLLWAGDLDRDGKIDLLLDVTMHYALSKYTLFLSSQADDGNLVREVAHFTSGSC